jgi:chemotaxis protein MotB
MAKRKAQGNTVPEWVVTYGDLMSLLLCFFILLAAFSELKKPREYEEVIQAIQEAFGYTGGRGRVPSDTSPTNSTSSVLEDLANYAEDHAHMLTNDESVVTGERERTTVITEGQKFIIGGTLLFQAGRTDLSETVKTRLREQIAPEIRGRTNKVEVRGHAWGFEDLTAGEDLFDVSYQRARAVVDYLVSECGVERRLFAPCAIGDSEPVSLDTESPRATAENRRVQVVMTEVSADERHPDWNFTGK